MIIDIICLSSLRMIKAVLTPYLRCPDNCPRGKLSPPIIVPWMIAPRIIAPDNCPRGKLPPGQLSSGAIVRGAIIRRTIIQRAIIRGEIIRGTIFLGGNCPRTLLMNMVRAPASIMNKKILAHCFCLKIIGFS